MLCVGIDPGITGAVAAVSDTEVIAFIRDTPVIEVKVGKSRKLQYLPSEMAKIFWDRNPADLHVYIEKVSAMPGQGVTSMFGFGKGYGIWIGVLAALKIPYTEVAPQTWKKVLMNGMREKDDGRIRAMQLFPSHSGDLARKKDIGRADALLIAEYGRRQGVQYLYEYPKEGHKPQTVLTGLIPSVRRGR